MAPLSKDRNTRTRATAASRRRVGKLAANAIIYLGALIAKNAAGNIVPASDAAAITVVGVAEQAADNTGGAAGDLSIEYMTGVDVELDNAGGAIVLATRLAYVADDHSVTTSAVAVHDVLAGVVSEFDANVAWCYVDEILSSAVLAAPLDGSNAATVADAQVLGGIPELFVITVGDVADTDTDVVVTEKMEVVKAWCQKTNGAGAGNTLQLKNGANAISAALACAVDNAITEAASLDDAFTVINAAGTLRVSNHKAAGTGNGRMFVLAIKRA